MNAYIYPAGTSSSGLNPYINDFKMSLADKVFFVNQSKESKFGVLDLYMFLREIDIIFLNWIEDLPDKRGGFLQTVFFLLSIYIMKKKGIKVFYTLHNKQSHYSTHRILKSIIRKVVLKNADFILFHSSSGHEFLEKEKVIAKKIYIPHPFRDYKSIPNISRNKFDILIWGSIRPYKGIDIYLRYLEAKKLLSKYKIIIIGNIFPKEYELELNKYKSDYIKIINESTSNETLDELIAQSRIVLFTYNADSVLSSGALIYSLSRGANIIGPNVGSFRDVKQEDLIEVFNDYDDLIVRIDSGLIPDPNRKSKILNYINENTWDKFGQKLGEFIFVK